MTRSLCLALSALALGACATMPPPEPAPAPVAIAATGNGAALLVQESVSTPDPDLLPVHATPAEPPARARGRAVTPLAAIGAANADARRRPDPDGFVDATQIYYYAPGALYEIYAAPGYLSTMLLEPGEAIVTVAAGDTTRWMIEEAVTGDAHEPRALLLIKPTRAGVRTNVVLVTDRRTYLIEAVAVEGREYSAQVAWRYPDTRPPRTAALAGPVALENLNFRYRIETTRGQPPRWRPVRAFDDGRRTYVEFPLDIETSEAPPLFLIDGSEAQLVNYRVTGNRYVIDRLFDVAELRLGAGRRTPGRQTIVRISREQPPRRARSARR